MFGFINGLFKTKPNIKKTMIRFYKYATMQKKVDPKRLPDAITSIGIPRWSCDPSMRINVGKVFLELYHDCFELFESYEIKIYIAGGGGGGNILVYNSIDGGWRHHIPKEMQDDVYKIIYQAIDCMKGWSIYQLEQSYNRIIKAEKLEEKQKELQRFEAEKNKLISIYKNKQFMKDGDIMNNHMVVRMNSRHVERYDTPSNREKFEAFGYVIIKGGLSIERAISLARTLNMGEYDSILSYALALEYTAARIVRNSFGYRMSMTTEDHSLFREKMLLYELLRDKGVIQLCQTSVQ